MASSEALTANQKVTQAELARVTGTSRQAIHDLVKRGIIAVGDDGLIDIEGAKAAILASVHPSSKTAQAVTSAEPPHQPPADAISAAESEPHATSYHVAKTMREAAEAAIAAHKLGELRGDLIRVDAVRSTFSAALSATRDRVLQIPPRMAAVLAAETNPARVHALLLEELRSSLQPWQAAVDALPGDPANGSNAA